MSFQAKVDKEVLLSDTFNGAEKLQQVFIKYYPIYGDFYDAYC